MKVLKNLFPFLFIFLLVGLFLPGKINALGFNGGLQFLQSESGNATSIQGVSYSTASPTTEQLYMFNATDTLMTPRNLLGGNGVSLRKDGDNTYIDSNASTLGTIDFETMAPYGDGAVDGSRHTVTLGTSGSPGVVFGSKIIPRDWNGSSDLDLKVRVATPDAPEAADVVVQLQYQTVKSGSSLFSDSNWLTIGTFTVSLANQATVQEYTNASFKLAVASMTLGDEVYFRVPRIQADAGDTHGDNLHVVRLQGNYSR